MIVIYAEKASLAKAIAVALKAGNRIANSKEPTIGHYEFTFNGEKAVLCHGVGHWICGINLTIAATGKYCANLKDMFRIGRVQTPVLAMVVEREKKINGHIRTPFWRL